jgi:leader peptidase (prepilin peptidase)/N-methyltransferase
MTTIRAIDNIPIVSYVALRGRCRICGIGISSRYLFIELSTGIVALATFLQFGASLHAAILFGFMCALLVVSMIDIDYQIIPNVISFPGIAIGFGAALAVGQPDWHDSLLGLVLGGAFLWFVSESYYRITGREGMGFGDVKLLAMIGAFLGWRAIPVTLLLASLTGAVIGAAVMFARGSDRRTPIPFGPFLAAGAVCALFFGDALIRWYLGAGA